MDTATDPNAPAWYSLKSLTGDAFVVASAVSPGLEDLLLWAMPDTGTKAFAQASSGDLRAASSTLVDGISQSVSSATTTAKDAIASAIPTFSLPSLPSNITIAEYAIGLAVLLILILLVLGKVEAL